ncbi:MAG: adenylate/guanylate cyclase domain-containing protein [Patescibacteria group bacterium]
MIRRFTGSVWFTAICVAAFLLISLSLGWFARWQDTITDLLFTPNKAPGNVVIVSIDEKSINRIGQWPWPRAVFGKLIENLQHASAIGIDVNFKERSRFGEADDTVLANSIARSSVSVVLTAEVQSDNTISAPISPIGEKAITGFPNLVIAPDGVARMIRYSRGQTPSFTLSLARSILSESPSYPGDLTRIDYRGPDNTYLHISADDVLNGRVPRTIIDGKIVLVGATTLDLQDFHETPFGLTSGVEIQANILTTLLENNFFRSNRLITGLMVVLMAIIGGAVVSKTSRIGKLILSLLGIFVGYAVVAFIVFEYQFILDLFYPELSLVLTVGFTATSQYLSTSREKKFIHDTFSRYLAPQVIEELIKNPDTIALGGRKANLSILFSDIRGFTTLSESMSPEKLTNFLNRYLTRMTDIILDQNGVVDKYIGDAIMAFWGAPLPDTNHARRSISSAIEMVQALETFNKEGDAKGDPQIAVGIGINTGDVTIGNMGSERRFDYTVLGDNVNLASRLEGLTKTYGVAIIVSNSVWESVPEQERVHLRIYGREIDRVQVKGKKQPVTIYEIMTPDQHQNLAQNLATFNNARSAYYDGNWDVAIEYFDEFLARHPNDGPSTVLRERCHGFKHRPMDNWQGVFEMTHK